MLVMGSTSDVDSSSYHLFYKDQWWYTDVEDYYVFTLTSQTSVSIRLNYQGSPTATLLLLLFEASALTCLSWDISNNFDKTISTTLSGPGTYIIAVDADNTPGGNVEYALDLYGGNKSNEKEVEDWYTLTLTSPANVEITLDIEGSATADLDLYLLNDAADTVLGSSIKDNPTSGDFSESIIATLGPGTYLIAVDAFSGTGGYRLTNTTLPNNGPYTPSNPSPGNGETDVAKNSNLSWTGGDPDVGNTVTYDVYFGTSSNPPLMASGGTDNSCDPGTLEYDTTYYWKIIAKDDLGAQTEGPIWNFTSLSPKPMPWLILLLDY